MVRMVVQDDVAVLQCFAKESCFHQGHNPVTSNREVIMPTLLQCSGVRNCCFQVFFLHDENNMKEKRQRNVYTNIDNVGNENRNLEMVCG
mmetsp:Transcript_45319/g.75584  ORF Transcript_45319/g.75584 Transcript_45319/m.75584 type:complete len:90 (-) Transcript_45319:330-599(-)